MEIYKNYSNMGGNISIHSYLKELDELDITKYKMCIENDKDYYTLRKFGQLTIDNITYIIIKYKKRYNLEYKFIRIRENNKKYIDDFFFTEYEIINRYDNEIIFQLMLNIIRHQINTIN